MSSNAPKGRKKRGSPTRTVAKPPKHTNLDLFGIEERMKSHAEHKRFHPELYTRQEGEKETAFEQYLTSAEEGNGAVYANQAAPRRMPRARPVVNVDDPLLPGYLSERNKQAAVAAKEQAKAYSSNQEEKLWWDWSKNKVQASESAQSHSLPPVVGGNDSGGSFLPQLTTSPVKVQRPIPHSHGQSQSPAQIRLINDAVQVQPATSKSPRAIRVPNKEGTRDHPQYRVGQRVQVKFAINGGTYPATIIAVDRNGGRDGSGSAYGVQYEDGQVDQGVEPQHIAVRPPTPEQPAAPPPIAGKARYAVADANSGSNSSSSGSGSNSGNKSSFSKGKVVEGLRGEGEEGTWCPAKVVDEAGSGALVVRFLDASQETVLLPLHRLRPNPVVARRQQRAAAAAAARAVAHEASYGEDDGGRGVREMSQERAAPAPYHPQASSSKPPPQNVGSNPFKGIKKKQKSGKKGNRAPPQGAKSIDEPRAVGFATRGQDLESAVAARADMRRANAKQRALQRESNAHQVNFAELKAAAYAAAKNRRQMKPSQQQQQSLQRGGAQGTQNGNRSQRRGGEGAALQPVIVEYDQVDMAPSSNNNHNRRGDAAAPKDNRSYGDKVQDRNRRELRLRILQNQF